MKPHLLAVLLGGALLVPASAFADVGISVGIGPAYPPPAYYNPPPPVVYTTPAPTYYGPPPGYYYAPPPAAYQPYRYRRDWDGDHYWHHHEHRWYHHDRWHGDDGD